MCFNKAQTKHVFWTLVPYEINSCEHANQIIFDECYQTASCACHQEDDRASGPESIRQELSGKRVRSHYDVRTLQIQSVFDVLI